MTEQPTYEELEQRLKELEQVATELKRSEELFRGLFANMTSGSGIYEVVNDGSKGSDYIVKEFNNKSLEIEGKTLEQVVGKTLFDLRPNIDDYGLIPAMKKVWETGLPAYHPVKLYKDNNFSNYYENYIFKIPSGEIVTIYNDITVQKNQEIALKESKERFELAMNFTNDGLWDWNLETNQIHYSSGWKRMLGYGDDEIKNEFSEWERLTRFEDMKASWDMMNELLEGKRGHFEKEFKMQHKDGHWVDILSRANVVFNEDGKGVRVVGTHVDITKRKEMEQSLYESEARFKALHNASFGGITIHDKGIILECNQGLSEITGYSMTELIGMNGLLLIAEKSRNLVLNNILSGYEKPYEAVGLRKNGEEYPIRLEARNIPYKGKNVRVVEFRDITEQKRVEKELLLTQYSINHIADSMFWTDKSAKFIIVNNAASKTLGYSREELLTMNIFDIDTVLSKEKWEERWEQIVNLGSFIINTIHKTKDGRKIPVELTINLVEYGDKQYNCAIARDITERKQAEEKQKELEAINLRLQKAESLSQMASGIAHLFNNYLYAISGNLELAIEELPDDSLIRKNLTEAMKAAHRCADVSGSMLTYLGQNIVKHESLDILECCRKAFANFQSQLSSNSGVTIETDLMEAELLVRGNANQMQQVLNHLITNAYESIGENKGSISLVTRTIKGSDISQLHLLPVDSKPSADTYVCLDVTDTGCGISKEDFHKLSDPFFTTKFTGRGLGLAVVSGIVKSWGGMIGVRSKVGHGSTFMVFLPLSADALISQTKELPQSLQPKKLSTVLLVEDHDMVLKITTIMLKRMGFEVISAVNGVEAVEKFRQHKESISCLITDLSMPELDGWGTLAEIRKIKPDIPAILASGYDESFVMSRDNYTEQPQVFLHKPYTIDDLKSALGQAMNSLFSLSTVN